MVDKYCCSKCGGIFSKDDIVVLHFSGYCDSVTEILNYLCRACYNVEAAAIKAKKEKS